jgi:hypothetical protein
VSLGFIKGTIVKYKNKYYYTSGYTDKTQRLSLNNLETGKREIRGANPDKLKKLYLVKWNVYKILTK